MFTNALYLPCWCGRVPTNVTFQVDDMEEIWTFKPDYFQYIHMRSMSGSFRDWDRVLKQAYE